MRRMHYCSKFGCVSLACSLTLLQGSASIWTQAVAVLFWPNIWRIHQAVEVSAAAQVSPRSIFETEDCFFIYLFLIFF